MLTILGVARLLVAGAPYLFEYVQSHFLRGKRCTEAFMPKVSVVDKGKKLLKFYVISQGS